MNGLDVTIHNTNLVSIKDLSGNLDISDNKWNQLFTFLTNLFKSVYFKGERLNYKNHDFKQTVDYVADKILVEKNKKVFELAFRMKEASLLYNRRQIEELWHSIEHPSFIFLGDKANEELLINAYQNKMLHEDIINCIENVMIFYRHSQLDVYGLEAALI